ncbi:MAG: hypothetical protein VXZ92_03470, partial [SAR324 cluster bacterium]|nr:hypothetical protein [SAR324 cluster bacterium]
MWLLFWTLGALILGWLAERWWCQILQEAEIPQPSQRCSSCLEMLTGWRKSLLFNAIKNKGFWPHGFQTFKKYRILALMVSKPYKEY